MVLAKIREFLSSCRPDNYFAFSKYKRIIWNILFVSLLLSVFLTVFCQIPPLADKNINHVADVIWIFDLVLLLIFDYKTFIDRVIKISLVVVPFSVFLLIAFLFKQPSFTGTPLTKAIYLSVFIMTIWLMYSPLFKHSNIKMFMIVYVVAAVLLASIVYFDILRGSDISSSYYAYRSKNSTGPILFVAIIFSYFLLNKKSPWSTIVRYLLYAFFTVIIALMKCRTVLIFLPISLIYLFSIQYKSDLAFIILVVTIFLIFALLFFVPYFRDNILFSILLNGKQNATIDDIFSGRFSIIYGKLTANTNYIVGNFSTYFDCMPLLLIVNYGFVGFLLFLPIIALPFFFFIKSSKVLGKNDWIVQLQLLFLISFFSFSIFEGLVPFGPGAETFVFWMIICCTYRDDFKMLSKTETFFFAVSSKINLVFNKDILTTVISSLVYGVLLFFVLSSSLFDSISSSIFDVLPFGKTTIAYVQPESVVVDGPDVICVGQKVNYKSVFNPSNTTDKGTRWDVWAQNNEISIDEFSGTVTANKVGRNITIIGKSSKSYTTFGRKMISVVDPLHYNFSLFEIHNEEDRLVYEKGETAKLIFDANYIPRIDLLSFFSSDESVAKVSDQGIISFISQGTVEIYSIVENDYRNQSNSLIFTVSSSGFIPTDSISVKIPTDHYQFEPLSIIPLFNDEATDKHYDIDIAGGLYEIDSDSRVTFLNRGTYQINICSRSNPALITSQNINIMANAPESIKYYGDTWWKVGKMEKLDLRLRYTNGFEKELLPSEILTTNNDYNKRAWTFKNGLCGDELSAIAITSGRMSIGFSLKQDPKININIVIKCNRFDYSDYCYYANCVGAAISVLFAFVFLIGSLINGMPINKFFLLGIYSLLYFSIAFVLIFKYSLSFLWLISYLVLFLIYFGLALLMLFKKRKLSFEVFCEILKPNNYPALINRIVNCYELNV